MSLITLAVLGGSGVGTPELFNALLRWPAGRDTRPGLRVVLLGRSAHKLKQVRAVCEQIVQGAYPTIHIEAFTDWCAGLEGADYILNQVRVGGLEARAHDETFPQELGIPGEETIGPGGFANALRTIPTVLESLDLISKVAPNAIVLNLTNPAGIVQHAAIRYTDIHMISLCDSPITLGDDVARLLNLPRAQVEIDYLGMNHLGWIIGLRDTEHDLMDRALDQIDKLTSPSVDSTYIHATRAIPIPYVRYYLHPERILRQQEGKVPHALINNRGSTWVVNIANKESISWLSPETVIEVPARIDNQGAHPLPVASWLLAEDLRALLFSQATYESLAVPAIVERKRERALQALVAHPLIRSVDRAESVLAAVWPQGGVNHECL